MRKIKDFLLHLRIHYQLLILSGAYLIGGLFVKDINWRLFILQFLNSQILLCGGETAYNSYWDKDTGPIGGLKNPPRMTGWMLWASLLLQIIGLSLGLVSGTEFIIFYGISMILSGLYSTPPIRWKSNPILSIVTVGLGTGVCCFFLGYFASGSEPLTLNPILGSLATGLLLAGVYPISQAYQVGEDKRKGLNTFAVKFGKKGISLLFGFTFPAGIVLLSIILFSKIGWWILILIVFSAVIYAVNLARIKKFSMTRLDYRDVMILKYLTSTGFIFFVILMLIIKV